MVNRAISKTNMRKSQIETVEECSKFVIARSPAKRNDVAISTSEYEIAAPRNGARNDTIEDIFLSSQAKKGFTLLEVLLSLAAIALISGISIPVYQSFQARNDLDIAATTYAQTLRRAQALSQAVDGDIAWGIYVTSGSITLFRGTSYLSRDSNFDEVFEMSASIMPSGITEIIFTKFTGLPQTTGSVTLTSNTNEARTVIINQRGMVNY